MIPSADNGLVELMVSSLAERAGAFGVARVSLNFAMFREAFERGAEIGAGPVARLWRQALVVASRNWQLESLYRSNAKYLPEWQPRFICFEYASDLPRVGMAAGSAEGFLTRPSLSLAATLGRGGGVRCAGPRRRGVRRGRDRADPRRSPTRWPRRCPSEGLPEQVRVRREKLDRLRAKGIDPYPVGHPRTHTLAQVREQAGELAPDTRTGTTVSVTGRILLKRDGGKLCFATLRDGVRGPAGDGGPGQRRGTRSWSTGSTTSTSATTWASPARSSPSERGELSVLAESVDPDQQVAAARCRTSTRA